MPLTRMGWVWLLLAGTVEVAWSQSIEPTQRFTRALPTVLCFALAASAVYLLTQAIRTVPAGTAYAVFTGIGAVGAVTLGILRAGEPATAARLAGLVLIVLGVVVCRLA